jgi:hypothetical protein
MKFTQVAADAFQKLQLNAGVLTTEFDPADPSLDRSKLFGATSGGVSFATNPEYVDFGEDIDNVPPNTKQLKRLQSVNPVMSGTLKTADTDTAKVLIGAADIGSDGLITPRATVMDEDFLDDLWWVGDYSDVNTDSTTQQAGFVAIHMMNVLSTQGLQLQSNDDGKGDFAFELTAHYDLEDIDTLPYEVYIVQGGSV